MPAFTDQTPREGVEIQGMELTIPYVYSGATIAEMDDDERDKLANFANERLKSIMVNAYGGDIRRELGKIDSQRTAQFKEGKYTGPMWTTDDGTPEGKKLKEPRPALANVDDLREKDGSAWDHQGRLDAKFGNYKVGEANTREAVAKDPTFKIAWDIAAREVKLRLAQKGLKVKPLIDAKNEEHGSEFNRLVNERLNHPGHKDRIYALAKDQVNSAAEEEDEMVIPPELQQAVAKTNGEDKEAA